MKKAKNAIKKKIIYIFLIILSFNMILPTYSNGAFISDSILRKATQTFIVGLVDAFNEMLSINFALDAKWEGIKNDGNEVWTDIKDTFHVNDNGEHENGEFATGDEEKTFMDKMDQAITGVLTIGEDVLNTYFNTLLSPEDIFSGNVKLTDANIFDQRDTVGYQITSGGHIMYSLKYSVASIYYTTRNLALVMLLCLLIYTGIRIVMASNNAGEKAKWQMYLMDWLKALALVMFVHVLMIGIFYIAEVLIKALMGATNGGNTIVAAIRMGFTKSVLSIFDTVTGWIYIIMYLYVTYLTIVFLIAYFKRLIYLMILIVIAPIMSALYAFGKTTKQSFNKWLNEFIIGVMVQPFHVLIYSVLILIPIRLLQGGNVTHIDGTVASTITDTLLSYTTLDVQLYALFALSMIRPVERYVRRIFGFGNATIDNIASYESGKKTLDTTKKVVQKVTTDAVMIAATVATAGAAAPALAATATTTTATTAATTAGTAAAGAGAEAGAAEAGAETLAEGGSGIGELVDIMPEDEAWLNDNFQPDDAMYTDDEYYWPTDEDAPQPQFSGQNDPAFDYAENEEWLNDNVQNEFDAYTDDRIPPPTDNDAPKLPNHEEIDNKQISQQGQQQVPDTTEHHINESEDQNKRLSEQTESSSQNGELDANNLTLNNANVQINQPNSMHVDSITTMEADSVNSLDADSGDGEGGALEEGESSSDNAVMDSFKTMLRGMPLATALGNRMDQLREKKAELEQNPYIAAAFSPENKERFQDIKASLHEVHDTFYVPGDATGDWKMMVDYKKEEIKKDKEKAINQFASNPKNIEKAIEKYGLTDKHNSRGEVTKTAEEQAKEKLKGMGDYVVKGIIDIDRIDALQKTGLSADDAIRQAGRHAISGTVRYQSFTNNQQNINEMATIVANKLNIPQNQRSDPRVVQQISEQVNQRFQEGAKYITSGAAKDSTTLNRLMELENKIDQKVNMTGTEKRSKTDYVVNVDKGINDAIRKGQRNIQLPNPRNDKGVKELQKIMNDELKQRRNALSSGTPRPQGGGTNPPRGSGSSGRSSSTTRQTITQNVTNQTIVQNSSRQTTTRQTIVQNTPRQQSIPRQTGTPSSQPQTSQSSTPRRTRRQLNGGNNTTNNGTTQNPGSGTTNNN